MFPQKRSVKRNTARSGTTNAATAGQPYFDEVTVTLSYSVQTSALAAASAYSYAVALNDVFDPGYTGSSAQPLAYDGWSGIYGRWTVVSSTCEVTATARASGSTLFVALSPAPNTSAPTTYAASAASKWSTHGSTQLGAKPLVLRKKISASQIFGVPQSSILAELQYSGTVSASPTLLALWQVNCATTGATDALSLDFNIKYRVRFWYPNVIVLSAVRHSPSPSAAAQVGCERPSPSTHTSMAPEAPNHVCSCYACQVAKRLQGDKL